MKRRIFRGLDNNNTEKKAKIIDLTTDDSEETDFRAISSISPSLRIPQPFYLTTVNGINPIYNEKCLSIKDLLHQEDENRCEAVCLMNYMIQLDWIVNECLWLLDSELLVLHGSSNVASAALLQRENWFISKVDLGMETYGTHHSKIALLFYQQGFRLVITTANFIEDDFSYRTQAAYVEDFPMKSDYSPSTSEFEEYLCQYLLTVHAHNHTANRKLSSYIDKLAQYDLSRAQVKLVGSSPGRHSGIHRHRWGIGRLHQLLHDHHLLQSSFDISTPFTTSHDKKQKSTISTSSVSRQEQHFKVPRPASEERLVMQFSSIGSMGADAKLLDNYAALMLFENDSEFSTSQQQFLHQQVDIVWPTVDCVRWSLQGYESGNSLPCSVKNLYEAGSHTHRLAGVQAGYRYRLCRWNGRLAGRERATPHMKCYFHYKTEDSDEENHEEDDLMALSARSYLLPKKKKRLLQWFFMTSMNMSQAAWGVYQTNKTKLYIKSYEMGVLYLPQLYHHNHRSFSCTPHHPILGIDETPEALEKSKGNSENTSFEDSSFEFVIQESFPSISSSSIGATQDLTDLDPPDKMRKQSRLEDPTEQRVRQLMTNKQSIYFPIPFIVPAGHYDSADEPWTWDRPISERDAFGQNRVVVGR
jgi:tyrosyl-DNA phosphodiesterase 1